MYDSIKTTLTVNMSQKTAETVDMKTTTEM